MEVTRRLALVVALAGTLGFFGPAGCYKEPGGARRTAPAAVSDPPPAPDRQTMRS